MGENSATAPKAGIGVRVIRHGETATHTTTEETPVTKKMVGAVLFSIGLGTLIWLAFMVSHLLGVTVVAVLFVILGLVIGGAK